MVNVSPARFVVSMVFGKLMSFVANKCTSWAPKSESKFDNVFVIDPDTALDDILMIVSGSNVLLRSMRFGICFDLVLEASVGCGWGYRTLEKFWHPNESQW